MFINLLYLHDLCIQLILDRLICQTQKIVVYLRTFKWITLLKYILWIQSFNTNMENCQMGRQNKILSISLIYKSMPTFHFTKWVQQFLKYLWVSVGVYKYQHTHNKETFHSGKFLVHFQSLSSIDIYMQMLLD